MSMFDFSEVNNIQESGKKLEANKIHKVVISALTPELMETVNGPSNVLKIRFTGTEGESEGATFEHILFEPNKEKGDFQGKVFEDGSVGVSNVQELQALVRQLLMAVSPGYAEFIKGGGVEAYASWLEWRAAIIKHATPAMISKREFELKLFARVVTKDDKTYINPTLPKFFLGKKRDGNLFSKATFFGHNLAFSQKWEKDQVAKTEAVPSDVSLGAPAIQETSPAANTLSKIEL